MDMFENVGGKIKSFSKVLCWLGIVGSVIGAIVLWSNNSWYQSTIGIGFVVLIAGSLSSWLSSMFLYAFGQITEDIRALRTSNDETAMRPRYRSAMAAMKQKKYDEAISIFEEISSFDDSAKRIDECRFCKANELKKVGQYCEAIEVLENCNYDGREEVLKECWYQTGVAYLDKKNYQDAFEAFSNADDYKNATEMLNEVRYVQAKELLASGDKQEAFEWFLLILDYKDVQKIIAGDKELFSMIEEYEQDEENVSLTDD